MTKHKATEINSCSGDIDWLLMSTNIDVLHCGLAKIEGCFVRPRLCLPFRICAVFVITVPQTCVFPFVMAADCGWPFLAPEELLPCLFTNWQQRRHVWSLKQRKVSSGGMAFILSLCVYYGYENAQPTTTVNTLKHGEELRTQSTSILLFSVCVICLQIKGSYSAHSYHMSPQAMTGCVFWSYLLVWLWLACKLPVCLQGRQGSRSFLWRLRIDSIALVTRATSTLLWHNRKPQDKRLWSTGGKRCQDEVTWPPRSQSSYCVSRGSTPLRRWLNCGWNSRCLSHSLSLMDGN